ncbi:MAG: pentapeptide repeat-containing protein [Rickettsiaceae bacterium]|nr:pentapeptide repeat-containing protein [Rickettsiaceae bacterium]
MVKPKAKNKRADRYYLFGINDDVPQRLVKVSYEDLLSYTKFIRNPENANTTLNQYIKNSVFPHQDLIIIADLSYQLIGRPKSTELVDLKGAIFTGCVLFETKFHGCNLEGASFRDTNLDNVLFKESNLNFVDFRGANLTSCIFDHSYKYPPWNQMEGIKFSATPSCFRIYADIKNEIAKKNEEQRLIYNKHLELEEIDKNTDIFTKLACKLNISDQESKYYKVSSELKQMHQGMFSRKNIIHKTFQNIFIPEHHEFDPIYKKGLKTEYINNNKKYISLSKEDFLIYCEEFSKNNKLSLNNFAKQKYLSSLTTTTKLNKDLQIIADFSSKVNMFGNNEWNRLDLSDLDLSNMDLSEVNFSGSNLSNCNFTNTKVNGTSFESSVLTNAVFKNSSASETNFFYADLSECSIDNSNFSQTIMSKAIINKVTINSSNFNYSFLEHCKLTNAVINNSFFNNVDLNSADLSNSIINFSTIKHSILNNVKLGNAKIIACDFTDSLLNNLQAKNSHWEKTKMDKVEATESNFTGATLSHNTTITHSNLTNSILDGVKATNIDFSKSILDHVKMAYSKLDKSCFNDVSMKFIELNNCSFKEAICKSIICTGAYLFNVILIKSNCSKSIFYGTKIINSNLKDSIFSKSDWQNIHIANSLLEHINNNLILINDNTDITNSVISNMVGQFRYCDQNDIMQALSIKQQQQNQQKLLRSKKLKKWGIFSSFTFLMPKHYRIPRKEIKHLCKTHRDNMIKFANHTKELKANKATTKTYNSFQLENLISSHNNLN